MAKLNAARESRIFLTIGQNGLGKVSLRQDVDAGTIGAVARDWEVNGDKGTKHEILHDSIEGKITGIEIKQEEVKGYGDKIVLTFDNEVSVSTSTAGKFGSSIMRQLPGVDLNREVKLFPYSYTPKGKTKESTGVSLKQGEEFDEKISDHFYDFENKKSQNGIPESDFDWATVEEWESKKFWADVDKFLQNYTIENVIPNIPEFVAGEVVGDPEAEAKEEGEEKINPEDIPF